MRKLLILFPIMLFIAGRPEGLEMSAREDAKTGQIVVREGDRPVLQYNYRMVEPPEGYVRKIPNRVRKFAAARSNYIHPLYGPEGEILTGDWNDDHPHHRGIYWAWPEVMYGKEMGDLHALQRVFARPTGKIDLRRGEGYAEIEAENRWMWEEKTPIVNEVAVIRVWKEREEGRHVDLTFRFTALEEDVSLARRGTDKYGGLNIRMTKVQDLKLTHHADSEGATPRRSWSDSTGIRQGGKASVGLAVFEKATNPGYPGDYVQYPSLPWFQPTFPRAKVRYELKKGEAMELWYRLWIRKGAKATGEQLRTEWDGFNKEKE